MKLRTGFVSNSSSSSFVVIFNKRPSSKEEVKNLLFPHKNDNSIFAYDSEPATIGQIVETVWNDLQGLKKLTKKELINIFQSGWREFECYAKASDKKALSNLEAEDDMYMNNYYKKYHELRGKLGIKPMDKLPKKTKKNELVLTEYETLQEDYQATIKKQYEVKDKLMAKMAKDTVTKILEKYKGKYMVKFRYSDNDGAFQSLMEHGDIFENIDSFRISHH